MPTIPQTQTVLQSYFQTGDMPSQDQFDELIGTMFYLFNESVSNAAAAAASAAAAAASAALLPISASLTLTSGTVVSLAGANGIASAAVAVVSASYRVTLTFTGAFANTNYKVFFRLPVTGIGAAGVTIFSQATGNCVISIPVTGTTLPITFQVAIFA
jgi:hypothetical protein